LGQTATVPSCSNSGSVSTRACHPAAINVMSPDSVLSTKWDTNGFGFNPYGQLKRCYLSTNTIPCQSNWLAKPQSTSYSIFGPVAGLHGCVGLDGVIKKVTVLQRCHPCNMQRHGSTPEAPLNE
jgi:hypothetical protein